METAAGSETGSGALRCRVITPARPVPGLAADARRGLLHRPRSLPPKYFYDERGSRLFDAICHTPEYYPTRIEDELLRRHAVDIIKLARPSHILELGSGTSRKTRHLLGACEHAPHTPDYWPFDVCEEMLLDAGAHLSERYAWLTVNPLLGDYSGGFRYLPKLDGSRLFVFLGGTIGNFTPAEAVDLLRELRAIMTPADRLLLGVDRVKDPAVLRAAYNDAQGITAEFNRNVLHVLNRELDADFAVAAFRHEAVYHEDHQRMEMYLVATAPQRVRIGKLECRIDLEREERILTEISCKFTPASLGALLEAAGLDTEGHFEPSDGYFSLVLARPG
ncbi:MAG: L-histidine N(alpha)-methyltransferase [Chromatiales bacterium 21-64-14]|nr:MAG: L-histidine N(alpha)-methyltransferase [Chromatiales bacterium 21-64-14]HQU16515.1 L-histidine N(alpha)-methyltransferase [Gammaproteobacteria bacterium]